MLHTGEVAVIGGSGFIGKAVVRILRKRGHGVICISREASNESTPGLRYVRADLGCPDQLRSVLSEANSVIHVATGGGTCWADFKRDVVDGARAVAEACLDFSHRRMVYVSSTAALYLGRSGSVDEWSGPDSAPQKRSLYARAKIEAEIALMKMHREKQLPVTILRPGIVVGNGGILNHSGIGTWPSNLCCLGWGKGKTPLPFVLVEDVAEALVSALETPAVEGHAFNLAGDVRPCATEWIRFLRERSRRRFHFYPQSLWKIQAVEMFKWALKVAARKPENSFPYFRDFASRSFRSQLDCTAAKKTLQWTPNSSLEVLLREAIDDNLPPPIPGDLRTSAPVLVTA